MELRTLGGLALHGAAFSRPKPLLLAAYLALEGPQPRRVLAELFWPGAADPMKSLTVALARLREGAPGLVDADRERAWTEAGSDAQAFLARLEEGDPDGALARYGGPFLHGSRPRNASLEAEEWLLETREFLAARARWALLSRAEGRAAAGAFREAARDAARAHGLAGAVPPEPEDLERIHLLLAAADHPDAARVGAEAEAFDVRAPPDAEGARARLRREERRDEAAALRGLPVPGTTFVGRERELRELATLLARPWCRLITLTGPAGVGKTRLALQAAHARPAAGGARGDACFVALEAVASPAALPGAIADALGLEPAASEDPLERVAGRIGERPLLLLLDNAEHLLAAAEVLARLVAACPRLRLLVTSRVRLDLAGEHVVPVAGLPYPREDVARAEEALRYDAVGLFVQRARRVRPAFEPDGEALRGVLRICRLTGGLPLALELAAAWTRALPCGTIAREIERDLDLLSTRAPDAPERHRSMRGAFEHSWRLLTTREQDALLRLSVFRGGFTVRAAREVAGAGVSVLASLLDTSMLRFDARGRYDRHPLLYRYTQEKLARDPELASEARAAHATFHLERLREWGEALRSGDQQRVLSAIEAEAENLRAAWTDEEAAADPAQAPTLAGTLVPYFEARQAFAEGIEFLDRVLERTGADDEAHAPARAHLRIGRARLLARTGRYHEARASALAGLAELEGRDDARGRLRGERVLAAVALHTGEHAEAERRSRDALALSLASGDERDVGIDRGHLGLVLTMRGETDEARPHLELALDVARERGDRLQVATQLNSLGLLHDEAGEAEAAHERWSEALEVAREVGDRRMTLKLLVNLGLLAFKAGDLAGAAERNEQALREAREAGDRMLQAVVLGKLGWIEAARGGTAAAEARFARALRIAWSIGETRRALELLGGLAEVRVAQARPADAVRLLSAVKHHPLVPRPLHEEARRQLDGLAERVPRRTLDEALAWGRETEPEAVVDEVLRGAPPSA